MPLLVGVALSPALSNMQHKVLSIILWVGAYSLRLLSRCLVLCLHRLNGPQPPGRLHMTPSYSR